jgi:CheY-like chemotaxis protein
MQSSKIDSLSKYNDLVKAALKASPEFPDFVCEYLVNEFEFQSAVLFKVIDGTSLNVIGRSASAKKSFIKNTPVNCTVCKVLKNPESAAVFNMQAECEIQASEFVIYEGCLHITAAGNEKIVIKAAKKSPFSKTDKEDIEVLGEVLKNLYNIWTGNKGSINTTLSDIVASIGHELRTPTNSIMGFASLLNEDNLTPSQTEYVSTLKENAFNLLSLINDLIDIARVDTGSIKESVSSVDIKAAVEDVLRLFNDKIDRSAVDFIVNIDDEVPSAVKIDSQKLRYILINIITCSLRLTERGKISVYVSLPAPGKVSFRISDTSGGISSAKLKDLFVPFAISEMGNTRLGSSTGLGLNLAKRYIELMKGNIEVISSIGKGTTYNFDLAIEASSPIETQISNLPRPGKKNNVLVVEDDYATSKLLSNYLNKWGYVPTIVNSADQALKAIDKEVFLAVLMDIVLPDANGFELLKRIREHRNARNTPVIVCSVEAEQQKAFLMGAVEYFVKPIKYKFLVEVLTSYRLKKDSNILIVDDDLPTLTLIKEAVEQAGYNAIAENHSSKVSNMIENMSLDLAIIDLDMPEVNGFDLIKQIKSKPNFVRLPVIIYTGKENYKEELKKIDGLFTDLLEKNSTNIEDLADTITQMINRYDVPTVPEKIITPKDAIKILLVEDYKHSQIIVTRLLKKNSFESIVVVENGAEAVDQVKKQKFDLILMDMQMPVMNGFEATEKIRQIPEYKETPIIALTAFAMKGDREKCLEAGATDYIPKPIDSQEFIEKVKYYTESKINA